MVRADGQVLSTGLAKRGDGQLTVSIGDVERPGTAPTSLAGRVTGRGVLLDVSVALATRVGTRATTDVRVSR